MSLRKFLRIDILFVVFALAIFGLAILDADIQKKKAKIDPMINLFNRMWAYDIQNLKKQKKLPSGFEHLQTIELTTGPGLGPEWLMQIALPIEPEKKKITGYRLELTFLAWNDEGKSSGLIVQHTLIDPKGNMIWDVSRNYPLYKKTKKP
jgi:hypothetical protein